MALWGTGLSLSGLSFFICKVGIMQAGGGGVRMQSQEALRVPYILAAIAIISDWPAGP